MTKKPENKPDLFSLIGEVKDNFEEFKKQADEKQEELAALRTTLWEILGPPPGSTAVSSDSSGGGSSYFGTDFKKEFVENLTWIAKNINNGQYNVALGRIKAMVILLTGRNP